MAVQPPISINRRLRRRLTSAPADLMLVNAKVITLDPRQPSAEAVAVRGEAILAAGRRTDVESLAGPQARTVDCHGMTLLPGFVDAHCHLLATAASLQGVDCGPDRVAAIKQLQAAIQRRAEKTPNGGWVRGFGYDDLSLEEQRHPTRWDLDAAAPGHPVRLDHRSGHAAVLNSHGLRLAGIHRETPDPIGGVICRDGAIGEPTGLLLEMAGYLRERLGSLRAEGDLAEGATRLSQRLLSYGITSVQDAGPGNNLARWRTFQGLQASGLLAPRVTMMAGSSHLEEFLAEGLHWGCGGPLLRLGHAKVMLTTTTGALQPDPEALAYIVRQARRAGFPVAIHAVEQEAVAAAAQVLSEIAHSQPLEGGAKGGLFGEEVREDTKEDTREDTREESGAPPAQCTELAMPKDRVEHCAECPPPLATQLLRSGATVVTQPGFVYWNGDRYRRRVDPSLLEWLYPIGELTGSGVSVAFGSDAPVIDPNPWPAIYSAVTGATRSGDKLRRGSQTRTQGVPVESALRMYTLGGAHAEGSGHFKGSIQPGKLADLVLVDVDPQTIDPTALKEARPVLTILGGRIVWEA